MHALATPGAEEAVAEAAGELPHLYIYALVRGDLEMPVGKLAAQAGHAFTDAVFAAIPMRPGTVARYRDEGGSKCVIRGRNLLDLERAQAEAEAAGVPCALVVDSGHVLLPHFDGSPIVTALGVGPCTKAEARPFLKRFSSL